MRHPVARQRRSRTGEGIAGLNHTCAKDSPNRPRDVRVIRASVQIEGATQDHIAIGVIDGVVADGDLFAPTPEVGIDLYPLEHR